MIWSAYWSDLARLYERRRDTRAAQITEAMAHLERVFANDGMGDCTVVDAGASLASEFVGAWRQPAIVHRLDLLAEAELGHHPRVARRHLLAVRRLLGAALDAHDNGANAQVSDDPSSTLPANVGGAA